MVTQEAAELRLKLFLSESGCYVGNEVCVPGDSAE